MVIHQSKLDSYRSDKFVKINLFFSLLINIVLWLLLIWQTKEFSGLIPLHYNIYFGIDLLGPWYQFFLLPSLGLLFFIVNFIISLMIYSKEKVLSYFLVSASSFIQLIFILAAIFIILINLG